MSEQKLINILERPRQQAFAALCLAVAPWMAALLENLDKYIKNFLLIPAMVMVGLMAMITGLLGCLGILWVGAKMIKHRAREQLQRDLQRAAVYQRHLRRCSIAYVSLKKQITFNVKTRTKNHVWYRRHSEQG